jgi:hypothetical protein
MSFDAWRQAVDGEVERTGASRGAAFRTLQLRQAAQLADLALDRLNWCHPSYAGDDAAEVTALADAAKSALDHALYGPNADPLEEPPEWMLPPSLAAMGDAMLADARRGKRT